MIYTTIGYDPITQKVFVGAPRENVVAAQFAAKLANMDCVYRKTFNIGGAEAEDYQEFFVKCGATEAEAWSYARKVAESLLEAMKGLPLTSAVYARRFDAIL
jgi:hypothetical protein